MFDGSEFLALANELLPQCAGNEAKQRCVIGRAYYAAFLRTRAYLEANGFEIERTRAHADVWNYMLNTRDRTKRSIGTDGKRLRDWRNSADYDIPYPADLAAEAVAATSDAQSLLERLATLV
jgi:uncharacterized protein (UPF0332 family)